MHRQHGHGVGVRIEIGRRRIVAGVDQRLQVAGHERRTVVGEERRLRADDVEESRDVAEALLGGRGRRGGQPRQDPAVPQEGVQHLAGGSIVGRRHVPMEVGHEAVHAGSGRRGEPEDARLPLQLVHGGEHGSVLASGEVHDRRQVVAAEGVHLRGREGVDIDARVRIGDRPQEGHQQPDLRAGVQPR